MLDMIARPGVEIDPPLSNASKRELIAAEISANPERSDREIARAIGVDHKTVASCRSKNSPPTSSVIAENSPANSPTPAEARALLINGVKDFDDKYPPETAEAFVDRQLASAGPVSTKADEEEFVWEPENSDIVCAAQGAIAIYSNRWNQIVIRQERSWDRDEDWFVIVARENLSALITKLQEEAVAT